MVLLAGAKQSYKQERKKRLSMSLRRAFAHPYVIIAILVVIIVILLVLLI
jgi:type II secretory pathway component PulF